MEDVWLEQASEAETHYPPLVLPPTAQRAAAEAAEAALASALPSTSQAVVGGDESPQFITGPPQDSPAAESSYDVASR